MKYLEEKVMQFLMIGSTLVIVGSLFFIFIVTLYRGGGTIIRQPGIILAAPGPRYLLGGGGGFGHAILGSLAMAIPATLLSSLLAILIAVYLQPDYSPPRVSGMIRSFLDILWGTPSIVYGIFVLTVLIFFHQRGSVMAGIIALTFLELPIITRYIDESLTAAPRDLKEIAYSMGLTRLEVFRILLKYSASGLVAGILIGLGRALGDAASVIFTTGTASTIPKGLFSSATALPVIIFQQANSFYPSVRDHAYAAGVFLITLILALNLFSRFLQQKISRYRIQESK